MYCTLPQKNKVSYFLTIKRCILQASLQIFASCPILRVSRLDPSKMQNYKMWGAIACGSGLRSLLDAMRFLWGDSFGAIPLGRFLWGDRIVK